jgi:hypothetical protein
LKQGPPVDIEAIELLDAFERSSVCRALGHLQCCI